MADAALTADTDVNCKRTARKCAQVSQILMREEYKAQMKKISEIIKKDEVERSSDERILLEQSPDMVKSVEKRNKLRELSKHRVQEIEDNAEELNQKCQQLAQAIRNAKSVVLYTGAGISTVKHVVSQNCDGLHLRSGLPRHALSEIHGNMFIELCQTCSPHKEYLRLFDVTEKTGVRKHQTGRMCSDCGQELRDSIVHFGERSPGLLSPYNWEEAAHAADEADLILCIGTSLKVLRKYPCLWSTHKPPAQKPDLYIINLQWTPKDEGSVLKINGKCDSVLKQLLLNLGLTADSYNANMDPIYCLATTLANDEINSTSKSVLQRPEDYNHAAVLSAIEHEKLRFLERKMKKGKRKRSNSRSAKEPVLSQYYSDDPLSDSTKSEDQPQMNGKEPASLPSPGCSSIPSTSRNGAKRSSPQEDASKGYPFTQAKPNPPGPMGLMPPLYPGAMVPVTLPLGLPATSPDLTNQSVDSIKFHQTLQMLQLQSQLHLHQQALTEQLPPSERARVLEQQDMMRQAFNSLLTQQLMKLEEKRTTPPQGASTSTVPLPVPLPPPIMTTQLGGLWPQTSTPQNSVSPPQKMENFNFFPAEKVKVEPAVSLPSLRAESSFPSIVNALQRGGEHSAWESPFQEPLPRKRKTSETEVPLPDLSQNDLNFSSPKLSGSLSSHEDTFSPHLSPPLLPSFSESTEADAISPMSANPSLQPMMLPDDKPYLDLPSDAKMKSALEFVSLLSDPAFKNSMCPQPSLGSPSYNDAPKLYEENQSIQRNLALVESVLSAECQDLFNEPNDQSMQDDSTSEAAEQPHNSEQNSDPAQDDAATNPGWFGKGWNPKKFRRKKKVK